MSRSYREDIKRINALTNAFESKNKSITTQYAAFAIPIIGGKIYLAVRNTPPHKGLYSAIGGKIEKTNEAIPISPFFDVNEWLMSSIHLDELGFEPP
jgi:hypothetical protein